MEQKFDAFNLGVSWSDFGYAFRESVNRLLDSRPDLTPQERIQIDDLWARHPNRQKDNNLRVGTTLMEEMLLEQSCFYSSMYFPRNESFSDVYISQDQHASDLTTHTWLSSNVQPTTRTLSSSKEASELSCSSFLLDLWNFLSSIKGNESQEESLLSRQSHGKIE